MKRTVRRRLTMLTTVRRGASDARGWPDGGRIGNPGQRMTRIGRVKSLGRAAADRPLDQNFVIFELFQQKVRHDHQIEIVVGA